MAIRAVVWGENIHEHENAAVGEIYPEGMHSAIARGARQGLRHRGGDRDAAGARARPPRGATRRNGRAPLVGTQGARRGRGRDRRARRPSRLGRHGADRAPFGPLLKDLQAPDGHAVQPEMARGRRARAALGRQPRAPDCCGTRRVHRGADDRDVRRALHRAGTGGDGLHFLVRGRRGFPLRPDVPPRRRPHLLLLARATRPIRSTTSRRSARF